MESAANLVRENNSIRVAKSESSDLHQQTHEVDPTIHTCSCKQQHTNENTNALLSVCAKQLLHQVSGRPLWGHDAGEETGWSWAGVVTLRLCSRLLLNSLKFYIGGGLW